MNSCSQGRRAGVLGNLAFLFQDFEKVDVSVSVMVINLHSGDAWSLSSCMSS